MDWSYLTNPEKGINSLIRLAFIPLLLLIVLQLIVIILTHFSTLELLAFLVFLGLVSPLAYAIREGRLGQSRQGRSRRGAERTPLLPLNEEEEEE